MHDSRCLRIRTPASVGERAVGGVGRPHAIAVWLAGLVVCHAAIGAEPARTAAQIYGRAKEAAVEMLVDGHHAGSGCFVSDEGLVITAAHVLGRPGRRVEVLTGDYRRLTAELVAVDLGHDVVLLRVPPVEGGYRTLPLASALPPPGAEVYLYSAAAFRHHVLQRGMMARGELTFEYQGHFIQVTQIAAMVQEGTSGGAWLNDRGEIIGVQSGLITIKSAPGGIANMAPVSAVRTLLETKRNAQTATIGAFLDELWVLPPDQLRRYPPGTEGIVVQSLQPDGPAARAGIHKGDVLAAVDGHAVRLRDDLVQRVRAKQPGQTIKLTVVAPDGTGTRELTLPLGLLEVAWPAGPSRK